jgi:hypothetical protein
MNTTFASAATGTRATFQHDVDALLNQSNPGAHNMMTMFGARSQSFVALRNEVVEHYFNELPSDPTICAQAMGQLVNSVIDTMQQDLSKAS